MEYMNFVVTRGGRSFIGEAITERLKEIDKTFVVKEVVAIVPRMLTVFGTIPQRFEVTEVELILDVETRGSDE